MKPIRLEIAGLQSYREAQTVDFERLCQGGVFGIFGPTGSGKSSILDAMTLALYGKVERAVKGTQGIMNGAENKLSVSLTFELSGAGESERYRVERQYKRAGETAVHGSICRLVQVLPEGDVVLADKQNEVDDAVERLIGLAMPDFTRAVVLPQGKFAEFLMLTGKDRRSMLQRLFHLERYGDALAARLSRRAEQAKLSLKEAEAEQQGLGDASPETLQAAAGRLAEARERVSVLRQQLSETEARHAELSKRREREEELKRIEMELTRLVESADEMSAIEVRLQRLTKAAELAPLLHDDDEAQSAAKVARVGKEEALTVLETRSAAAAQTAAEWTRNREEAQRREPELLIRLERLEQAVQTERECGEWSRQRDSLSGELTVLEQERGRLAAALTEQEDLLVRGKTKQASLKEQLTALLPAAETHGRLQTAAAQMEQLAALQLQEEEAAKESGEVSGRVQAGAERQRGAEALTGKAADEGRMLEIWWSGTGAELARFRTEAARSLEEGTSAVERLQAREREMERLQLAHVLAENLTEGGPCPVCGSFSHPQPGVRTDPFPEGESLPAERKVLTDALQRVSQLAHEAKSASERAEWHLKRLAERLAAHAGPSGGKDEMYRSEAAPSAAESETPLAAGDAEGWNRHWDDLSHRLGELTGQQDRWESKWAEAAQELAQAREASASLAALAEQTESRRRRLAEQAAARREAWAAQFPELSPDGVRLAAAEAAAAEKETRDLRERLDKSIGFLEEQERKQRETERGGHDVSLKMAETKTRLESVSSALVTALARLKEWTGGESAAVLSETTKQDLERLRTSASLAKTRAENADRERQEAQSRLDTAAERDMAARSAVDRAAARLAEGLSASVFDNADEIRQLLPDLPAAAALKERLDTYRQTETQLNAQRKLLRERMTGEPVSEAEWAESVVRTESLKRETEDALSDCAKAERDVDDLSSRRERWEELERRRTALAAESSRIGQLQSVFRGNAFVEYIAEEQLEQVCISASERLGFLTRRRYALEIDAAGGFVIRDDANGGLRRPVSTLSGGETFLTSLALSLSLSAQIQLRGKYPLQFFFLDEGFGTLDPELLDTVVTSLEKLQHSALAVGVISHVPELQARLPRKLHVAPAEPGGRGSRITYETM